MNKTMISSVLYTQPKAKVFEICTARSLAEASFGTGGSPEGVVIDGDEFVW